MHGYTCGSLIWLARRCRAGSWPNTALYGLADVITWRRMQRQLR